MDHKLARGYAREGRRKDERLAPRLASANNKLGDASALEFSARGKLSSQRVEKLAELNSSLWNNVVFRRTAVLNPGWGSAAKVQIKGTFAPEAAFIGGRTEMVSRYLIQASFITRKAFDHRQEPQPLFLREHALVRCIERSDASYGNVFPSLWPAVLLPMLVKLTGTFVDQPIALPVQGGLFLGDYRWNGNNELSIVRRTGHLNGRPIDDVRLSYPDPSSVWINTFISFAEMSDAQATLWLRLTKFLEASADELLERHALAPLTFAGANQPMRLLGHSTCRRLAELIGAFTEIYSSKSWRETLRRRSPEFVTGTTFSYCGPPRVAHPQTNWKFELPKSGQSKSDGSPLQIG